MVRRANKALARLDAEAIKIVARICHATTTIVKIHVKIIFVDRMHCVKSKITWPNVNVRPDLKEIQHLNKDAFVFHRRALQQAAVRTDTCALQTCVKCHVLIPFHVQLVNDAIIMCALKFATQTIIVCPVKFVMNVEHANRDAQPKQIAHQRKSVRAENASVDVDSLEHHSVVRISMNVQSKFVTRAQFVRIHQDRSNVFAQSKQLAIHTQHRDACCQINVHEMRIVPKIWLVSKENAQNHVISLNADEMRFANRASTKHSVNVHQEILAIQPIKLPDASESNVLAAKIAVKTNIVIHKSINVKVSYRFLKCPNCNLKMLKTGKL